MPEHQIQNWLIINWKDPSTRTRKSEPKASDLGTHELATELTLDVVIPEVDVDSLHARVEVPTPRVEQSEIEGLDAEDAPDWQDVADEAVGQFFERHDTWADWRDLSDKFTLNVIRNAPSRPPVEKVQGYLRTRVRGGIQEREEAADA